MGAGKSTVGPLVARRLGLPFFDLDREIERRKGSDVATVFATRGEVVFRTWEHDTLVELLARPPMVLALGGGTLHFRPDTRPLIRFPVVWLTVPLDVAEARLAGSEKTRPLLKRLKFHYESRRPKVAKPDFIVDGEGTPDEVADRIVAVLG